MKEHIRFVGLDVHAETITVAVAEAAGGEVREMGTIPNREESIRKLMKKLRPEKEQLYCCYEAGPTGYVLYWQLTRMGVSCVVVAPTLVPVRPGDKVKTDRRDARKLARLYRSGELTPVWVPDQAHEALRDLVRAREAAKRDETRARHRLSKFLLRHGRRPKKSLTAWTVKYLEWVCSVRFEHAALNATLVDYLAEVDHMAERVVRLERALDEAIELMPAAMKAVVEALQALRGVKKISAATVVAEVGPMSRFEKPRQLMGYSGAVSREDSSGEHIWRGSITKTGNAHLRRIVGEAAWHYQHRPCLGAALRKRQAGQSEEVKAIAWRAQHRLHGRYWRHLARGKHKNKVVTAIARELLGFIWAIGVQVEKEQAQKASGKPLAA
jgi:transposase